MNHIVRQPAFTDAEIVAIQGVLHEFPLRDKVLLHAALMTALRISSLLQIRWRDVLLDDGSVRTRLVVPRSAMKGGRGRGCRRASSLVVTVAEPLRAMLSELKFGRFGSGQPALLEPVFLSRERRALSRRQATHRLKQLMLRAGLQDRSGFGWHGARRWAARSAFYHRSSSAQGNLVSVAAMLGHRSHATTAIYVGVDERAVEAAFVDVASILPGVGKTPGGLQAESPSAKMACPAT